MPNNEGVWVPDRSYWYWRGVHRCIDCNAQLKHYRHLQNHWLKWHCLSPTQRVFNFVPARQHAIEEHQRPADFQPPVQRFFVWDKDRQIWMELSRHSFIWMQQNYRDLCFAYTKEPK